MEKLFERLVESILTQDNLPGAMIVLLILAVIFLWRQMVACQKANIQIIGAVEKVTAALNNLTAWGDARNMIVGELKEAVMAHTMETKAMREYIIQLAEVARDRYEQLQRDIAKSGR